MPGFQPHFSPAYGMIHPAPGPDQRTGENGQK